MDSQRSDGNGRNKVKMTMNELDVFDDELNSMSKTVSRLGDAVDPGENASILAAKDELSALLEQLESLKLSMVRRRALISHVLNFCPFSAGMRF